MARQRIAVKKIRKVLKLKFESGLSIREIAALTGISKTVVSTYIAGFKQTGTAYAGRLIPLSGKIGFGD